MEQSIEFRYDTQLLIESENEDLDEDEIRDYITANFVGDSLVAAGDEELVKIHFHTNEPGRYLSIAGASARSTISWSRIWTVSQEAFTADQ